MATQHKLVSRAPPKTQPTKPQNPHHSDDARTFGDSGFASVIGRSAFGGAADIVPMDAIVCCSTVGKAGSTGAGASNISQHRIGHKIPRINQTLGIHISTEKY